MQSTIRLLGVTLDSKLSFKPHVLKLVKDNSNAIYALRKIRCHLSRSDALRVYTSMIRSRLEYCSIVLFCSGLVSVVEDLEKCQHRAVRCIYGVARNSRSAEFSITNALADLRLPTLEIRRSVRFCKFVHRLESGGGSPYLRALLDACGRHGLALRNGCNLILPHARSRYGKARFVYQAVTTLKSDLRQQ